MKIESILCSFIEANEVLNLRNRTNVAAGFVFLSVRKIFDKISMVKL